MEDIIVLRIGNGISVLSQDVFHKNICDLIEKMNKSDSADKYYYEDLIEDLLNKYINYSLFKKGRGFYINEYSKDDLIVLRMERGMSLLTIDGFYNKLLEIYEKMIKTTNKQDKFYYQELIDSLVSGISLISINNDVKVEPVKVFKEEVKPEETVEEPVKNKKIINITGYKKVYANNKSYASAMN